MPVRIPTEISPKEPGAEPPFEEKRQSPPGRKTMTKLRDRCRFDASDGRWELFKTTKKYDGDLGRTQHGFPSSAELPA